MTNHHAVLLRMPDIEQFEAANYFAGQHTLEYRYPTLGINEVRSLITDAYRAPAGDATSQLLIVRADFITEEAQHALLKVVEEPPATTKFVFVLPSDVTLLPTLLSRLQVQASEGSVDISVEFDEFLKERLSRRMKLIEKNGADKKWIQLIKTGLSTYAGEHRRSLSSKQLVSLEYVARHLLTRGASNKFLLEHAALVLPA